MDANQQKILGYFIEEAKEHLETLANGLMDLPKIMADPEEINELFRAAHSIKGGSAMLGYNSIQRVAHRLEDCFKILREHDIKTDAKLESLFLKGYDTLSTLIDQLDSAFGLQDEEANKIVQHSEPDFAELEKYLNQLLGGGAVSAPPTTPQPAASHPELSPQQQELVTQCKETLKEMLSLFKQKSTPEGRKKLQKACVRLAKLSPKVKNWQRLTKSCHQAIANPKFSYRTLAPIIIQELKQGADLLVLDQGDEIKVSENLKQLASTKTPQILIPVEPKAAAKTLLHVFNKKQLSQIVELLNH